MEKQKVEDFIKESLEDGFIRIDNEVGNPNPSMIDYLDMNRKQKFLDDLAATPQLMLFHPESKVMVEIFAEKGEVVKAHATSKVEVDSLAVGSFNETYDAMVGGEILLSKDNFKGETTEIVKKVNVENPDDIYEMHSAIIDGRKVEGVQLNFAQDMETLTLMERRMQDSPIGKAERLNDLFGDHVDEAVKSSAKLRMKNRKTM